MLSPIIVAFTTSTHTAAEIHQKGLMLTPGGHFTETYSKVLFAQTGFNGTVTGLSMMLNSLILGLGFAIGKIVLSMMAAYSHRLFPLPLCNACLLMIFTTLLLPLEVAHHALLSGDERVAPAQHIYRLILPLLASATGTFFLPAVLQVGAGELLEAARIDGAGPFKVLHRHPDPAVAHHDRRCLHHHVRLWLEPVSLAHADDHRMRASSP